MAKILKKTKGIMSSSEIEIEIIDQPDALEALGPAWRELCERILAHGHYLTFDWHWRAWDSFNRRKGRGLCIAAGRRGGRLVLILPLVAERGGKLRGARWLGAVTCYYSDALVLDEPAAPRWLAAAWRAAVAHARIDYVVISSVRQDGALHGFLAALPGAHCEPMENIGIAWRDWADWDAYWNSMSAILRRNQAYQYRRLSKRGEIHFETVSEPAEVSETIRWMVTHKREWLAKRGFYGDRFDDAEAAFLQDAAADAGASGALYLGRIRVGQTIIAAELGFADAECMHAMVTSYDRAWHRYSPGRLMYENSIRLSWQRGIPFYDFNASDAPYKAIWGRNVTPGAKFMVPCTAAGRLYVWWYGSIARKYLRALYRHAPLGLRRKMRARLDKRGE